jgi:DNA-binding transcriptional MerR regulator
VTGSITNQTNIQELDVEWVHLILSARKMGLSMEDIRAFLRSPSQPAKNGRRPLNKDNAGS